MKSFFRNLVFLFSGLGLALFLTGCGQSQAVTVKSYNNSIVQIQKEMLAKAQDATGVFDQKNIDPQVIVSTLSGIQSGIQKSYDQFKAIPVPQGAEPLADAMNRFFQVEVQGIQRILQSLRQITGNQGNPAVAQGFSDTFSQFSSQENAALNDFYATQQQVAGVYGQQVIQVDN
jgi:hypothetical protein